MLRITNLKADIADKQILRGVNLEINPGELHVLMGPNGSGKSTLAKTILGHPSVELTGGKIVFDGNDISEMEPDERARLGVFLAFQYPIEVPGVNYANFLRLAYNSGKDKADQLPVFKFRELLKEKAKLLGFKEELLERNLNEGLSGGEKKKAEILQMAVLEPKLAILDETDSGLDVDALKIVFSGVNKLLEMNSKMSVLVITHYQRIFDHISPKFIHVMNNGSIVDSGGMEIAEEINKTGYSTFND